MRIAILSFSSFVKRKLLPSLEGLRVSVEIDIYTRRSYSQFQELDFRYLTINFFDRNTFDDMPVSSYHFVYISSANNNHYTDLVSCIATRNHVLVDKPAFLSSRDCFEIVSRFRELKLYICEVVFWHLHDQIQFLNSLLSLTSCFEATSRFLIPALPVDNYRMSGQAGSGVFHDMSAYAFSVCKLLDVDINTAEITISEPTNTGQQYFILHSLSNNRRFSGVFGFGFDYCNSLHIVSHDFSFSTDRVFTTDPIQSPLVHYCTTKSFSQLNFIDDPLSKLITDFIRCINGDYRIDNSYATDLSMKYSSSLFQANIP